MDRLYIAKKVKKLNYLVYFIIRAQTDNRISKSVTQNKIYTEYEYEIQNQWERVKELNQIRNVEKHNVTNIVVKC